MIQQHLRSFYQRRIAANGLDIGAHHVFGGLYYVRNLSEKSPLSALRAWAHVPLAGHIFRYPRERIPLVFCRYQASAG